MGTNEITLTNLNFLSATELVSKIKSKEITSVELVKSFYSQIEKYGDTYNAVITLNKKQALNEARDADIAIKEGRCIGKLQGVPITIKDTLQTKGLKTTAGFPPLENYIPDNDATIVSLLRKEGAIIIGKTNTPTLAMDLQANNPIFGTTNNPWDITRTSGGSSGGCATALATGMTPLSFGSDLAGSIRQPSSFCGVFGLKPTCGVVSLNGHIPPDPDVKSGPHSLAVLGPLARSIDDLELSLGIIAQRSELDRLPCPLTPPASENINVADLKIAWMDDFSSVPVDDEIKQAMERFVTKLKSAGATVVKIEPDDMPYQKIWHMWGRLVGLLMNHDESNFKRRLLRFVTKKANQNKPMLQKIFDPISVTALLKVQTEQIEYKNKVDNFLAEYDAWIFPTSSTTAFKHITATKKVGINYIYDTPVKVNNKDVDYWVANTSYTIIANVTENPVVAMPISIDSNKLPIGIQVMGQRYGDFRLLAVSKVLNDYAEKIIYPLMAE